MPDYTNTYYLARLLDKPGTGTGTGTSVPVYGYDCYDCGPADQDLLRWLDLVSNPAVTEADPEPLVPVLGQITPCQKDWEGAERYVDYDMGGGHVRRVSHELTMLLPGMNDCTLDGSTCVYVRLDWNGTDGWEASQDFVAGSATYRVYGVWTGIDEEWFIDYGGCLTGTAVPLSALCSSPLRLSGTGGGGPYGLGCCDAVPAPQQFLVWDKGPPVYAGRAVDVWERPGTGTGTGTNDPAWVPVYLVSECCQEGCPFNPGCCDGVPIDAALDFTFFNLAQDAGSCLASCTPSTISASATSSDGCVTFSVDACPAPNVVCLTCDLADSSADQTRNWDHYRLLVGAGGTTVILPTSGSCTPFSVTFDDVPWTAPGIFGTCTGTVSVTVTR